MTFYVKTQTREMGIRTEEMYERPHGRKANWHSNDILIYTPVYTDTQFWPVQAPVIQHSPHFKHQYCCGD